jgi:hypothetical protein
VGRVKRFVDQTARVYCGMRGRDVDIETCLGCVSLKTYDLDSRQPYVVCERPDEPVSRAVLSPRTAS